MKKISVILPTWNEHESIKGMIADVLSQQKNIPGWEIHVVVSDDVRTTDSTEQIVKDLAKKDKRIHLLKVQPGLGVGLIKGHQYALEKIKPDLLAQIDADGQVEVDVLPRFVKRYEEGYELIIGSRFVKGGRNDLDPSRKLFTWGAGLYSRIMMGHWNVKEFTNSARAFTPQLFRKIDLNIVPWQEQTYIVQPAFLHAALLHHPKYIEVPLVFKNRLEGYSKNKVFNMTYDVIAYGIEVRLKKWGINLDFYRLTNRAKTFVKFGIVGFMGTLVDFIFYKLLINMFLLTPAVSKGFSSEMGIINNFLLNNFWTFKHRKTGKSIWSRFGIYHAVSLGGLLIAVIVVYILDKIFGSGLVNIFGRKIAYNNFYFFATIPPVMAWNFTINHLFTWKHKKED